MRKPNAGNIVSQYSTRPAVGGFSRSTATWVSLNFGMGNILG